MLGPDLYLVSMVNWLISFAYLLVCVIGLVLVLWAARWTRLRGDAERRAALLAELGGIREVDPLSRRVIAGFFHPYWLALPLPSPIRNIL